MKRFILVSFAFLAVAFYQMSGGANFEPPVETIPIATTIKVTPTQPLSKPDQVQAASLIARPATNVSTVKPTPVTFVQPSEPVIATTVARVQDTQIVPDVRPFAQPLVLASLEQGLAGLTTAVPAPEPAPAPVAVVVTPVAIPADIREITATRVNMRDGPGTTYPILTRLTLGHEVEILDTPGNGWLRLRTLPEQRIGWISASLVSKASR